MTELTLLADDIGVNERTLRRAINEGALRAARPTPRALHMPLSERGYVRRHWPLLAALRGALRTERNVRFALLFGSTARGTDTATSDVDIIVDLGDPDIDRVADLAAKLTTVVGRPVEIVRLEDAEADPRLLGEALREGRVIVDRARAWPRLRRRAATLERRGREVDLERAARALASVDALLSR